MIDLVREKVITVYNDKQKTFGEEDFRAIEHFITLNSLDNHWKEHLLSLDHLKEGIGLRGYGQKDPLREYQRESYELFIDMLDRVRYDTLKKMFAVQPAKEELTYDEPIMFTNRGGEQLPEEKEKKIGRNDHSAPLPLPLVSNYMMHYYRQRQDLRQAYPEPFGLDRLDFVNWFVLTGRWEHKLHRDFVVPMVSSWCGQSGTASWQKLFFPSPLAK